MNTKDFIRLGVPLGEATRRATGFVAQFILSGGEKTRLEVNPFPAMCHVTLQWSRGDRLKRREIEAELAKLLDDVESPHNPAARWLMSVAGILMGVVSFGLLLLILFVVFAALQTF